MKEYSFVKCGLETPSGWDVLVEQMLDDIEPIAKENPDFEFIQIKEKYNRLVAYPNMIIPEIEEITRKYADMASLVCARCGRPATKEMQDYILSYCDDCWKDIKRNENWKPIEFTTQTEHTRYSVKKGKEIEIVDFSKEWERMYDIKH